MRIMMKIQGMTKIIYPTDGHTDSDDERLHTFFDTRTHTRLSSANPRTSQI